MLSRLPRKVDLTPFVLALLASAAGAAYDVNDVTLGAAERDIKQRFPNAYCRALEWPSRAADRRCDDSRITFGGVDASVTFYLKRDSVEGFDVRFDHRDIAKVIDYLQSRYGKPLDVAASANPEPSAKGESAAKGEAPVKVEWKSKDERARLTSEPGRRRASLLVWRGAFEEEIYKVR
jgi:hypothetical protein